MLVRVLRWLDCVNEGTTMVGLWCSGYCDGWTAVVRVLRWFDCVGDSTTMAGLRRSG